MANAWIGLGSNLENPSKQVSDAFLELAKLPKTQLLKASKLWKSKPLGPQDQPDFINAVAEISTELEPLALLHSLQAIEALHQRKREQHWGPRTLDLDILLYDEQVLNSEKLTLPHPGIAERAFVLCPLAELNENLYLPNLGSVKQLIQQLGQTACSEVLPLEAKACTSF
ncbi:2-amino-4-hydroxy-6-hydroxymethyldihydropteridine diphosphokinase [Marinospirillum insulare]|uniref:2-amino-4-hydroxy-6-hydroxymethyldihydropteridine pyrophosphokinase n=1 Tax=Marinospirillum insulare TaxID=217169 RepID=A0ABQ5ZX68_9GAMM|nr:2-amino-4-hydroxy-6-hydroxymethyldihydropteridine diphosphokinase [Marinospirillum insulare]GLR64061.1 2-amino-4-hydroxy-6-hydroxymethyldihydropteridine pyrophosphokinase [Marinospirillum insulare]